MLINKFKMNMDYEERYNKLIEAIKVLQETNPSDVGIQNWVSDNVPELVESDDERIRKWLEEHIEAMPDNSIEFKDVKRIDVLHWLEKQGDTIPDECVFRPVAGCDIKSAAEQAIKQQGVLAKKVVLAFNGFYIPVNGKAQDIIINEYNSWLEKQGKEEYALKSFRDKDVREFMQYIEKQAKAYEFNLPNRGYDIYAFAKDILYWLEKQGKQIHSNSEKVESRWNSEDEETMRYCRNAVAAADYYTEETKEEIKDWLISLRQRIQVKQ